ncbi:hypothetical protein EZS27_002432 [termite gut metagenome]|uniref:DUF3822 family protein n=1 Tax=termite gut metagenome TaxID=433724 RepID=A0A5J4SVD0_9ZZZZ
MPERAINKIDLNKSEQLVLSIRLKTDGFSVTIYHPFDEQVTASVYKEADLSLTFTANLKQAFSESDFLTCPYKQVDIIAESTRFTALPLNLFDEKQTEFIFAYNHLRRENETILYNVLKKHNMALIFGIDKNTHQFLTKQYSQASFYSQVTPFIEYLSTIGEEENILSKKMYLCLHEKHIDICCLGYKRIIYLNAFECKHTEDCLYYALHLWKQINLNQKTDNLYLAGTMPDKKKLIKELKRYISNVRTLDSDDNVSYE